MVYVPTGVDLVTIQAVDPPGPTVVCRHGDGVAKFSSTGGWQMTKRPKRTSMTEWMGADPYTLVVPIQFGDGADTGILVDPAVEALRGIMRNPVGPRNQPAVVTIRCPLVPLNWLRYVIQDLQEKDQMVNEGGGRYFQSFDLVLYQWEPTDLTIGKTPLSVAQKIAAAPVAQSSGSAPVAQIAAHTPLTAAQVASTGATYTVKSGDTLSSIAAAHLGSATRWTEIAALNNIRDPRSIYPGQTLRMPSYQETTTAADRTYAIPPGSNSGLTGGSGIGIRHF